MKRLFWGIILPSVIFMFSCESSDVAFEQTYSVEDSVMCASKPYVFDFVNTKDSFQLYNVVLEIKHLPNFPYTMLPILLGYMSPKGETATIPIAFPVYEKKDYNGEKQSDGSILLKNTILYSNRMQEGKNLFTIEPATFNDSLYGVTSVTLRIEKAN